MEAASEGQTELVRVLLGCGADKTLANHRGSTANELATNPEIKAMLTPTLPTERKGVHALRSVAKVAVMLG